MMCEYCKNKCNLCCCREGRSCHFKPKSKRFDYEHKEILEKEKHNDKCCETTWKYCPMCGEEILKRTARGMNA